ncbi:MAG: SpoIIE family protein phosphatase [Clostridia bacterium]|nr:SpoIIE family protein phosphatase [Clostridia bacterium]
MKQIVAKIPLYYGLFALLSLTERTLGLYGLAAGCAFALLYCREKIWLFLPSFAGAAVTVSRSVPALISTAAVIAITIGVFFLHRKIKKRYFRIEFILCAVLCQTPHVAFGPFDALGITTAVVSVGTTAAVCYLSLVSAYPILVRGIRYPFNNNENVCLGILIIILSIGIAEVRPFSVNVQCLIFSLFLSPLCAYGRKYALPYGLCVGAGAAIGLYDPSVTLYFAAPALAVLALSHNKSVFRVLGSIVTFFLVTTFFFGKIDLYSFLPFAVGSALSLLLFDKFVRRLSPARTDDRYALRTVVNRDRETLATKLSDVARAFADVRDILIAEVPSERSPETVVKVVCEKCCIVCPYFRKCFSAVGDLAIPVRKLVLEALSGTRVSILDADANLGKNCQKLPYLLHAVNEECELFRKENERRSGLEKGKEAIVTELDGFSDVLQKLATFTNVNLTFDIGREKALIERLSKSNVPVRDVCIYVDGSEREVTLIVRESDADKTAIPEIVGEAVGMPMKEFYRKKEINGEISLHFCRAPSYKILYGECFSSKENRCGDTRQAVRIDNKKTMFILSDGMGTGARAKETATGVAGLVETFYRAGFNHETVFANVSNLLSLRSKEDFSALDAVIIDLRTAEADFIKQGGRESYVFTGDSYEIIEGDSLPLGIIETTPQTVRKKLRPDDLIILMSDGVADALAPSEVAQILKTVTVKNPKAAADALIENAVRLSKKPDDMTVVAMRLVRA